jgi:multimeric flavodoxin WrbA
MSDKKWDFSNLRALFFNGTLTKSPGQSHTEKLIKISREIMEKQTKKVIERLYACSSVLNKQGQYAFYGKVGGCLITGNEDGIKHCAQNVLYSLQHVGYSIPPQADAGWIGEAGPGPSYGDKQDDGTIVGVENDFTNRNTTFMSWNLMHLAKMLKDRGGVPAYGNQRSKWDAGSRFDFENPEYR